MSLGHGRGVQSVSLFYVPPVGVEPFNPDATATTTGVEMVASVGTAIGSGDALTTATGIEMVASVGTATAFSVTYVLLPPVATISAGGWTSTGANLWSVLDEAVTDDADFMQSATSPVNDVAELDLQDLSAVGSQGTTTIVVRVKK
jgi:hypothetical protein